LEHALRRVDGHKACKYVCFIKLSDFSLFNSVPWHVVKETLTMLVSCFPECAGSIVAHCPPTVFNALWAASKPLIDPKTRSKIVFVSAADEEEKMQDIIGHDWRRLTGTGLPRETPKSSPGYRHDACWRTTLEHDLAWRRRSGNAGQFRHEVINWPDNLVSQADESQPASVKVDPQETCESEAEPVSPKLKL
jgi:hypothetical protein